MKVVVIDSGISLTQSVYIEKKICIVRQRKEFIFDDNYWDEVGHGTAIIDVFLSKIEKRDELHLSLVKLDNGSQIGYDLEQLIFALDYIINNIECDMLLISSGTRVYSREMYFKLYSLYNKGVVIFSAFDNRGGISYPAAFDCVIGVDVTNCSGLRGNEFVYLCDNSINVVRKDKAYRVKWLNEQTNIVKGSSFVCGDIAGEFTNYCIKNKCVDYMATLQAFLTGQAKEVIYCEKKNRCETSVIKNCKKAAVFPFNKEIHALASNEDLLMFEVVDYYDIRQSGRVGISVDSILKRTVNSKVIKNIEDICWEEADFDTFILGHCVEIENIVGSDIKNKIITNCRNFGKSLIVFDDVKEYVIPGLRYYQPHVDDFDVPYYNYGKLYLSNTPVLGIFGTSSKQGKFTLQLMLRRLFMQNGYRVAQIGTEPSSELFGMDFVFPMGYNSSVSTKSNDNIAILNNFMHECEMKAPDIIIIGSQSGTCPYNIYNMSYFTLPQIEFLLGTQPDVVVLCVNVGDDLNYVNRTIKTIEGTVDCKVVAFSLFPRKMATSIEMISTISNDTELRRYKEELCNRFGMPVFLLDEKGAKLMYKYIIEQLS